MMALMKPLEWWSGWADVFGVSAAILGGILVLVTLLGWTFSWKAGRLKDEALKRYQVEAKQSIAEAQKLGRAMHRLTEPEEFDRLAHRRDHPIHR